MAPESSSYPVGSLKTALLDRLNNRTARIGVIGLGYVGLPLIRAFIAAGFRTMGFDVDHGKVERFCSYYHYKHSFGPGENLTLRRARGTVRRPVPSTF